jgi:hypothetical protein
VVQGGSSVLLPIQKLHSRLDKFEQRSTLHHTHTHTCEVGCQCMSTWIYSVLGQKRESLTQKNPKNLKFQSSHDLMLCLVHYCNYSKLYPDPATSRRSPAQHLRTPPNPMLISHNCHVFTIISDKAINTARRDAQRAATHSHRGRRNLLCCNLWSLRPLLTFTQSGGRSKRTCQCSRCSKASRVTSTRVHSDPPRRIQRPALRFDDDAPLTLPGFQHSFTHTHQVFCTLKTLATSNV